MENELNELALEEKFLYVCLLMEQHMTDVLLVDEFFKKATWDLIEKIFIHIDSLQEEYIIETTTTKRILKSR